MGSYTFKWEHPAQVVYVTGTFDNWGKSVKLEQTGDTFEQTVPLPETTSKILYKFVVDGKWTTNESAPQETDDLGNLNNVLLPEDIVSAKPEDVIMSTVASGATTTTMAGATPLEKDLPGAFPETPTPAAENKEFSVNPLPATAGFGNPIKLAPGEQVPPPADVTTNTVDSTVKLDKESYEKADRLPGGAIPNGTAAAVDMPPHTDGIIPESSLPMGSSNADFIADGTILTAGAAATTAVLAGQVPLEKKAESSVPDVVKESQEAAGVPSEASANPAEVQEKAAVEAELKQTIAEAPVTSESDPVEPLASTTPAVVKDSVAAAHTSGEAAANPAAVADKAAVEQELLAAKAEPSRDVSPRTVPGTHSQPAEKAAEKPLPPTAAAQNGAGKAEPVTDKKKKRASFFGRLKAKLSHHA